MVKFACDQCGRSYSVTEELRSRSFKMKCKSCGHLIVVKPAGAPDAGPEPIPRSLSTLNGPPPIPGASLGGGSFDASFAARDRPAFESLETKPSEEPSRPAPSEQSPQEQPPPDGYVEFRLDDQPEPKQEPPPAAEEPHPQQTAFSDLVANAPPAPQGSDAIVDLGGRDLTDPVAGWGSAKEAMETMPVAADPYVDAEPTGPAGPPRAVPTTIATPARQEPAAPRKKGGLPKPVIYAAAAVVVAIVVGVVATRKGDAPKSPSSTRTETTSTERAGPAPSTAGVKLTTPELAAPDPRYVSNQGGHAPAEAPAAAIPEKRSEAEASLQGRPVTATEVKPEQAPPPAAAPTPPPAKEVAKPAKQVKQAKASPARGPDQAAQAKVIAGQRRAFDDCLAEAARNDPGLRQRGKKLNLVLTVDSAGEVTSAALDDSALNESQLHLCLSGAARHMSFPSFEGESATVRVPLSFSKGK